MKAHSDLPPTINGDYFLLESRNIRQSNHLCQGLIPQEISPFSLTQQPQCQCPYAFSNIELEFLGKLLLIPSGHFTD